VLAPKAANGGAKIFGQARVLDNDIRRAAFPFDRPLGGFAAVEFSFVPAAVGRSGEPDLSRRIHKNDHVAHRSPASFEEERRIQHDGDPAGRYELLAVYVQSLSDAGMERVLEEFTVGYCIFGIAKNASRHGMAIDAAIGREDGRSPTIDKRRPNIGIVCQHFMPGSVGVEDASTQRSELLGNERLAASDTTDNAKSDHLPTHNRFWQLLAVVT
jgi:hypothetical protein